MSRYGREKLELHLPNILCKSSSQIILIERGMYSWFSMVCNSSRHACFSFSRQGSTITLSSSSNLLYWLKTSEQIKYFSSTSAKLISEVIIKALIINRKVKRDTIECLYNQHWLNATQKRTNTIEDSILILRRLFIVLILPSLFRIVPSFCCSGRKPFR